LEDLETVLYNTGVNRRSELLRIGENLARWQDVVRKEKAIYETMNLFNYDVRRKTLVAEGWVPTRDLVMIHMALRHATVRESHILDNFSVTQPISGGVWNECCSYLARITHEQNATNLYAYQ
jgi:vacuolar-type H+-ATPase subunit I/STV1